LRRAGGAPAAGRRCAGDRSGSEGVLGRLTELWAYRRLIVDLVLLDLKVRYKGSALGFLWSLLNPLLMMVVFTVVFDVLFRNNIARFPVFILAALLPWNYLATVVTRGTTSVTQNAALLNKVYFPSEVFPIATVLSAMVNFLLALPVLFGLMWLFGIPFTVALVMLPVIVVIQTLFCIAIALFVSALTVQYRDMTIVMEVLLQAWFFLTPIFYPIEEVTKRWNEAARVLRWLNPMAAIVDFYRDILYGGLAFVDATTGRVPPPSPGWPSLLGVGRTFVTVALLLALAYVFFVRRSERFAEEA
jgi:lipopolysaccharide transport system permease protein